MKILYNNPQDLTFLQKGSPMKRLALSLLLSIPAALMYSMDDHFRVATSAFQSELEEQAKKAVLAMPVQELADSQLAHINLAFSGENVRVSGWFAFHMAFLQPHIQQCIFDAKVTVMGSRRWQTSHLLSDIDAAVVTSETNHEKVVDALEEYYKAHYPQITQFRMKTKAGLSLFTLKDFSDPHLGSMKLEYTIQSQETNNTIVTAMKEKLKTQGSCPGDDE
jgi:hypothetical protein